MPTYTELAQESWWRDESVPPALDALGDRLVSHYGVSPTAVGVRGDNKHLRGYHRSRNWIKNSIYCTNRTYSVTETTGNRSGGDGDWCCALDLTIPRAQLLAACQRLDVAVRAGRLEKITEWYGNTDGDDKVDGYNNIENRVATSDSSHLWHLHMSFDRGRANEDHTDVYEILTGDDMGVWEEDVIPAPPDAADYETNKTWQAKNAVGNTLAVVRAMNTELDTVRAQNVALDVKVTRLETKLDQALAILAQGVTPAQLATIAAAASSGAEKGVDEAFDGATVTTTIDTATP